jgi:hypothetical protein
VSGGSVSLTAGKGAAGGAPGSSVLRRPDPQALPMLPRRPPRLTLRPQLRP